MGFAFAFVATALVLSFMLHNREVINSKLGLDFPAIPLYDVLFESKQDGESSLNYGVKWSDFWEFIHRSWTSVEETTSKYVPSRENNNSSQAGRRDTHEAARLFVEGAAVLFPCQDEFVQRLGLSFLSKQDKNTTKVMHFVGPSETGKNRTGMLLARSLFVDESKRSPLAVFSSTFQNNEQAKNALDNLSANLDTFASGLVLMLRNYAAADVSTWNALFNLVTSVKFVDSESFLIFIEDVGLPHLHLINIRLSSSTDLNDARDLIHDKLHHIYAKKESARSLLKHSTIVPFLPKSVRTIEAYIKRACDNLNDNAHSTVVCDAKSLAQAAVKLEPCVESEGFYSTIESLQKALKHALETHLSTTATDAVLGLEVDVAESSSCDEKGMGSWLNFKPLESF